MGRRWRPGGSGGLTYIKAESHPINRRIARGSLLLGLLVGIHLELVQHALACRSRSKLVSAVRAGAVEQGGTQDADEAAARFPRTEVLGLRLCDKRMGFSMCVRRR
jgi:hypothetical protein